MDEWKFQPLDLGFTFVKSARTIVKLFFQSGCLRRITIAILKNSDGMGRVWLSVHSAANCVNVTQLRKAS